MHSISLLLLFAACSLAQLKPRVASYSDYVSYSNYVGGGSVSYYASSSAPAVVYSSSAAPSASSPGAFQSATSSFAPGSPSRLPPAHAACSTAPAFAGGPTCNAAVKNGLGAAGLAVVGVGALLL